MKYHECVSECSVREVGDCDEDDEAGLILDPDTAMVVRLGSYAQLVRMARHERSSRVQHALAVLQLDSERVRVARVVN